VEIASAAVPSATSLGGGLPHPKTFAVEVSLESQEGSGSGAWEDCPPSSHSESSSWSNLQSSQS
jgi:hypothetical protein